MTKDKISRREKAMTRQLAIITLVLMLNFLPLAFGQDDALWRADDPRTANPINRYHTDNPLNPANKYRGDNDFNPANKFKFDNPLNPANKYKFDNLLNPANRFDPDSPLNPINRYRSPDNPPKERDVHPVRNLHPIAPQYEGRSPLLRHSSYSPVD